MCTKSRDVMEGASKGLSPLLKIIKDLRGTEPASLNMFFRLDKFQLCIYQRRERKEECYNPVLAFSFYSYFQIHSSNNNISFINAYMQIWAWSKVWFIYFLQNTPLVPVLEQHHWLRDTGIHAKPKSKRFLG